MVTFFMPSAALMPLEYCLPLQDTGDCIDDIDSVASWSSLFFSLDMCGFRCGENINWMNCFSALLLRGSHRFRSRRCKGWSPFGDVLLNGNPVRVDPSPLKEKRKESVLV